MSIRNKEYLELLKHAFDENKFVDFIVDLLNLDSSNLNRDISKISNLSKQYENNIQYYKFIANYYDGMNNIGIFIIKLNVTTSTKARSMQRNFVATLLSKYNLDASLVAFYSDKETSWRLSFVKKELSFSDKGIKEQLTPAKRYSYLVGENESVHTAQEFLLKLLDIDDRKITLDDIEKQFDVEKVTKKFFEEYKEKYLELKEFLDKNEDFQTEAKNCDFDSIEFAKKLMGQIVFLYFLQKKGWLGVQLVPSELSIEEYNELLSKSDSVSQNLIKNYFEISDDKYIVIKTKLRMLELQEDLINLTNIFKGSKYDMPWGTGKKDFIRCIFNQAQKEHKNFFDDYLEYFFYKGLNEKRENQYFPLFNCKIPFLNGGLFEPLNNYRWSSAHFEINNSLFSNDDKTGILDFLDLYNFTIDEEEPLEKEIAVDPEMLGKIFENLLDVNDRKSKGAFYTPREIVHYMCQESLANYLVNKVNLNYDETIQFIKYGDVISQYDWEQSINDSKDFIIGKTLYENLINIDDALINVKIADPAVGSGAFPLGMLNEIVKLRTNIQSYILIQQELGLVNIQELYGTNHLETDIYKMKLQTIENSIYAVDIESSAVDIAKLRLWLSLIVDYPNNQEPQPLPNLDYKIMQGNSLLDEYEGIQLFSDKILNNFLKNYKRNLETKNIKEINIQFNLLDNQIDINQQMKQLIIYQTELFKTSDSKKKKELKEHIEDVQLGIIRKSINDFKKETEISNLMKKRQKPWFIWKLEFFDVFKENGGFDIVIGNPPYGLINKQQNQKTSIQMNEKEINSIKNNPIYEPSKGRFINMFSLFICKGLNLLNESGNFNMIFPMAYMCDLSCGNLRKMIFDKTKINMLDAFPERDNVNKRVFASAKMSVCILNCSKTSTKSNVFPLRINNDKFIDYNNEITNISLKLIKNMDPNNYSIPLIHNNEIKLFEKISNNSIYLNSFSKCYEGEINITTHKQYIKYSNDFSPLIRGAQVQKYKLLSHISQGDILYLDDNNYLKDVNNIKSTHHNFKRIIMQGITGINEKSRLKMTIINNGIFCANSVNYLLIDEKYIYYILAILNSNLMNWYYKKISTNSNVNGYEVDYLPIIINKTKVEFLTNLVKCQLTNYQDEIEKVINETVYEIYDLDFDEIKIVESK